MARWWIQISRFARVGMIVTVLGLLSTPGCTTCYACFASAPRDVQLRIVGVEGGPRGLVVFLAAGEAPAARPDPQGRVKLSLPSLRGGKQYAFGFLKSAEGPLFTSLIHVQRDGVDLRTLPLADLAKLPLDDDGYRVLELDA